MAVTRAAIERALDEVTRPFLAHVAGQHAALGGTTEVRILDQGGVWRALVGPATVATLVDALRPAADVPRAARPRNDPPRSGEANVYFTLGAARVPAGSHPDGRLRRCRRTTRDDEIVASPWVAVDVDPVRASGESATDAQLQAARVVAHAVRDEMAAHGVNAVLAESGNGFHLLAATVPAVGAEAVARHATRLRALLLALDRRYSTEAARVDGAVFNPSRIFKLYGTVAVKGTDTERTPHRLSHVAVAVWPEPCPVLDRMEPFVAAFEASVPPRVATPVPPPTRPPGPRRRHTVWRQAALAGLDLTRVYGDLLVGEEPAGEWWTCRDPASPSGDRNPSAGVATGRGKAERGSFHSFRSGATESAFDFLVRSGAALDLQAAFEHVASLSGCPIPWRTDRSTPEATAIDDFARTWHTSVDDAARDALMEGALGQALTLPPFVQALRLDRISQATGTRLTMLTKALAALRRQHKEAARGAPRASAAGRTPTLDFIMNTERVDDLFERILAQILPKERFFRYGTDVVFVQKGLGPKVLDERNFPGVLHSFAEIGFLRQGEQGVQFDRYDVLSPQHARAFLNSPRVTSRLPQLLNYARAPLFDEAWSFVARFGWHPASSTFYDGPEVQPTPGTASLDAALAGFRWRSHADQANFVGALLTMLTIPHWTHGHPFLAVNGNKAGVGKSTLARVLGAIVEGSAPPTLSFSGNDEEFEKQLATRVEAGDRVIVIDNARFPRAIQSPVLERCITDARPNFRRLGSNTAISRPANDLLFVLTMNLTQLGPDLRRRALPVHLEVPGSVHHVQYDVDDPVQAALEHRLAILAELAHMVTTWLEGGRLHPDPVARHSTGQAWARTIDAILWTARREGFLTNFEDSAHAFDPDYQIMTEVAAAHHAGRPGSAADWCPVLLQGPLSDRLRTPRGDPKSPRSQQTLVGALFSNYVDETFVTAGGSVALRCEPGRTPTYWFEPLPNEGLHVA